MPIDRLANEMGVFRAEELQMLGRVFDQLVDTDNIRKREALASRILGYYEVGVRDEDELLVVSKVPLGR